MPKKFNQVCEMVQGFVACQLAYDVATEVERKAVDEMLATIKSTHDSDDINLCVNTIADALYPHLKAY